MVFCCSQNWNWQYTLICEKIHFWGSTFFGIKIHVCVVLTWPHSGYKCSIHHFQVLHEWLSNSMPLKPLKPSISFAQFTQIHAKLLTNPKPHIFNPLLGSLVNSISPENGLFLYNQMLHYPSSHNHFTFTYALKACCFLHQTQKGLEIHAHLIKSDVVSWTSIISGFSKLGFEKEALGKFLSMNVRPNSTTLVTALSACSSLRRLKLGKAIHGLRLRTLNEENVSLENALLDFYVRCAYLRSAENLFEKMHKRDVVSWTTMIGGYAQSGLCEEAVRVFQNMVHAGEAIPNEATLVNVLSACSSISALHLGQWVHSYINSRHDVIIDGNVGNALINMYVKCGNMEMAILIFKAIEHKDIISWSTVISGLAMNGLGKQAFVLFSLMLVHGISPDDITFLGLLSACSHGGLINQGMMVFEAMKDVYNISPQIRHYACMVDMYGKAGLLDEAEAFIKEMPMEAEGPVWGALLHACQIHGNEKKYEKVRECLLGSKGVTVGAFALLSNTYASCDRWNDANDVRVAMRSRGLKKMAGCSWIELVNPSNPVG
ncbi:pentatricopeptide repeat-containing protein At1g08070, chloroplastic-like isoform X2 [Cucumis melo]|uniref:Pentatricopeptide repeat-containing protein At1g08070, chloroplastic-like isoform X2 n=1 Tax=Cucumis melo TaxID=3656 RepID=A0ABM3KH79_CUCME|nr:pentatricopeptide repeat-containing protein At1g08070, chloroplastic-like isoform X2 [Cucumis melo]